MSAAELAEELREAIVECRATTRRQTVAASQGDRVDYREDDLALARVWDAVAALERLASAHAKAV